LAVKLKACKYIPILVYGKKQVINYMFENYSLTIINTKLLKGLNKNNYDSHGNLKFNNLDGGMIVSVYLDNENLEQYHARINKEEGATLIRVRWYNYNNYNNYNKNYKCSIQKNTKREDNSTIFYSFCLSFLS
jgi:SPX domain protein involved in polyphosphate accumulation